MFVTLEITLEVESIDEAIHWVSRLGEDMTLESMASEYNSKLIRSRVISSSSS